MAQNSSSDYHQIRFEGSVNGRGDGIEEVRVGGRRLGLLLLLVWEESVTVGGGLEEDDRD